MPEPQPVDISEFRRPGAHDEAESSVVVPFDMSAEAAPLSSFLE